MSYASVAICERRRVREATGVEPLSDIARRAGVIADNICVITGAIVQKRVRNRNHQGLAGSSRRDAVQAPTSDHLAFYAGSARQEALPCAEREFVGIAGDEIIRDVDGFEPGRQASVKRIVVRVQYVRNGVDGLRVGVRYKRLETIREPPAELCFESVEV